MTPDRSPAPAGHARDRRRDVRRGVALAVVAGLALAGVYAAAVLTPEGQYLDDRVMLWAALDRGIMGIDNHGLPGPREAWSSA